MKLGPPQEKQKKSHLFHMSEKSLILQNNQEQFVEEISSISKKFTQAISVSIYKIVALLR